MTNATVIVDASHCHQTGYAGWAAWIRLDTVDYPIKKSGTLKKRVRNSTEAEMYGALNAIVLAHSKGATDILVQCDNDEVCRLANRASNSIYASDWAKHIAEYAPSVKIRGKHVKGHTSRTEPRFWVNNWCDKEAKKHMRAARRGP